MFVQVIKGKTSDADALRRRFDEWKTNLASGATGWRGSTAGVTDDGTFIGVVEFESAQAARRNSDRPEQGQWWAETEPLIADAQFADSDDVVTFLGGADGTAGFVQVVEATVPDRDRARAFMQRAEQELASRRPDLTGGLLVLHDDRATDVVYFTDEEAARKGEAQEMTAEERAQMDEMSQVFGEPTFLDLRDPWHHRP